MIKWLGDSMIEVIQFIIMVAIISTTIGWGLDWIFSGTFNPIYVEDTSTHDFATMRCRTCGHQFKYSVQVMQTNGEVKCPKCGSFLTEE